MLHDIAGFHARYIGRTSLLDDKEIRSYLHDLTDRLTSVMAMWKNAIPVAERNRPTVITPSRVAFLERVFGSMESEISPYLKLCPKTVVHGDLHAGKFT